MFRKKRGVVDWLFLLIGAKFFLDWILPTNPQSKNIIIRYCWGNAKNPQNYNFGGYKIRFYMTFVYSTIHISFCYFSYISGNLWTIGNILVNIYPIIIQFYIGYRILLVMIHKRKFRKLNINMQ